MYIQKEDPIEDFQIIQVVLKGNHEAYAELVRAYHARVRSHCLSMLLDQSESEDAAQETFLKAFTSLHQYKKDLSFPAWLHRIASNHCLDVLRKRKRQRTDSLDTLMDQKGDNLDSLEVEGSGGAWVEKAEKLNLAFKALSCLTVEQRQILFLRDVDGLRYDQIGSVLQCSLDAVKARLRRARQRLIEKARHLSDQPSFIK